MSDAPLIQADSRIWRVDPKNEPPRIAPTGAGWFEDGNGDVARGFTAEEREETVELAALTRLVEVERERDEAGLVVKHLSRRLKEQIPRSEEYRETLELILGSHPDDVHDLVRTVLESTKSQNDSVIPSSEASDE